MIFDIPNETEYSKVLTIRILNFITFIASIVINAVGMDVGAISDTRQTWITPGGYAFAIWGVIYFFLMVFVIYQVIPKTFNVSSHKYFDGAFELISENIHFYFILANIFNAVWILVWPLSKSWISIIVMILLWLSLAIIYYKIGLAEKSRQLDTESHEALSSTEPSKSNEIGTVPYFICKIPFTMYFAWITCASFVNLFAVCAPISEQNPFISIPYAIAVIILLGIITLAIIYFYKDVLFALVVIWALVGIIKGKAIAKYPGTQALLLQNIALGTTIVISCAIVASVAVRVWKRNSRNPYRSD